MIRCMGPLLGGNLPPRFNVNTSGNSFLKKSFREAYSGGSSTRELVSSDRGSGVGNSMRAFPTLTYLLRSVGQGGTSWAIDERGISFRATGSIDNSFSFKKGIPKMTSCDARGATLKIVGFL